MHAKSKVHELRLGWCYGLGVCSVGAQWDDPQVRDEMVLDLLDCLCAELGGRFRRVDRRIAIPLDGAIFGYCEQTAA